MDVDAVTTLSQKIDLSVATITELLEAGWTYKEALSEPGTWSAPISSLSVDLSPIKR